MNLEDGKKRKSRERAGVRQSLRSQLFARGVAAKYCSPLGTGALDFLSEYFGARFSSAETERLAGEKLYRKTGRDARRSRGRTGMNFSVTLNVTQQILASYPSLIQLLPARETVRLSREVLREKQVMPDAPVERPLVLAQRATRASRESKELLTVHERVAREIFSKVKLETVRERFVTPGPIAQPAPLVRYLQPVQTSISLTRLAQTLLLSQVMQTPSGPQPAISTKRDSITRAYVSTQSNVMLLSKAAPRVTTLLSERTEYPGKTPKSQTLERTFFSTVRQEGRARLAASEKQVAVRLLGSSPSEFIRSALSVRASLYDSTVNKTGGASIPARLLNLRPAVALTGADLTRKASLLRASVGGQFLREPRGEMERVLVALRQETRLELPKVARVFAPQPQRPVVEARKVVKQVEEKEVIETIRREVTTQMKSYRAADNFTRADFTIITDHVYDALARRLLSERERLGLNS